MHVLVRRPCTNPRLLAATTKQNMAEHGLPLDLEQKHSYVHSWLEQLFQGEGGVPEYEINSQTIEQLYQMALRCQARERSAKVIIEDLEQKAEEYSAETARLQAVTEWLGFSSKELPPSTQGSLQALAGIAGALEIKDCSDTSFCLALSDLCQHRARDVVKRGQLVRDIDAVQESIRRMLVKQANQRRVLAELGEEMNAKAPVMAKQKKESEFLKQKAGHYQKLVSSMTEELNQVGYEPGLSHATLQQYAKEVDELQAQLAPLKEQLTSYQDLPPDLDLARVKVESARRELGRLESELAKTIDLVHVEK